MIVWRIRGKVIRTVLCCIVYQNCPKSLCDSSYRWTKACCCKLIFCVFL